MMRWAKEALELADQWAEKSPSVGTRDAVAEAHFFVGVSCMLAGDWEGTFFHFAQQLRIKIEIGKINGIAAGLFNLGSAIFRIDPGGSTPLLLTAEQISLETEGAMRNENADLSRELIERGITELVSDASKREVARQRVAEISPDLLPFFERSLTRWEGIAAAAASAGIPVSASLR
jgi:hypothetical protein